VIVATLTIFGAAIDYPPKTIAIATDFPVIAEFAEEANCPVVIVESVIFAAVIVPSTILFALTAVRPILSPVIDWEPNESTTALAAITPAVTFVRAMKNSYDEYII
jgi:hypothetical protein